MLPVNVLSEVTMYDCSLFSGPETTVGPLAVTGLCARGFDSNSLLAICSLRSEKVRAVNVWFWSKLLYSRLPTGGRVPGGGRACDLLCLLSAGGLK